MKNRFNEIKRELDDLVNMLQKQNEKLQDEIIKIKNGQIEGFDIMDLVSVAEILTYFGWDKMETKILLKNTQEAYKLGYETRDKQYQKSLELFRKNIWKGDNK